MQQFVVPQFIDVEDKILGPITTRQFLQILAAAGLIFLWYNLFNFTIFVILTVLTIIVTALFAFFKPNGQFFHYFVLNVIQTLVRPAIRVWNRQYTNKELDYFRLAGTEVKKEDVVIKKAPQREHIRDLSLIVNTGGFYRPDEDTQDERDMIL